MSQSVTPFEFNGNPVRTVIVNGEPWFIAADACAILEIVHAGSSLRLLDDDEKGVHTVHTPGGLQEVTIISESGLYSLVLRSRKEEAREFKRWITREVLPQIRQTGSYSVQPMSALDTFAAAVEALREQERRTSVIEARQEATENQQRALESRTAALEENHDRVTAIGWANLRKVRSDVAYLNRLGSRASKIAKRDGIEVSRAHSTVWGEVNAWPLEVWDEAHEALGR